MSGTVQSEGAFKFAFIVSRFRGSHYSGAWNRLDCKTVFCALVRRRIMRGRFF